MLFKFIGHDNLRKQYIQLIGNQRIPHAQLILGDPGYGTLSLALFVASCVLCDNKQQTGPCGTCAACHKTKKLIHPDLHFAYPVTTTKTVSKDPVSDDFIAQWREMVLESTYFTINHWYNFLQVENKQGQIGKSESESILRKLSLKKLRKRLQNNDYLDGRQA
ncbi:MAG: hypothetical protein HC896_04170 [Bacteroidales bacterium]|nr:hypothetical protein [Bacteroidales bacterium]